MPLQTIVVPCPRCRVSSARMIYASGTGTYICTRCEWNFTVTAGGVSTTLNGLTAIGATTATLTSAAAFTPGNTLRIDTAGTFEDVTPAISGNVLSFTSTPLKSGHANGATVAALSAANALT